MVVFMDRVFIEGLRSEIEKYETIKGGIYCERFKFQTVV